MAPASKRRRLPTLVNRGLGLLEVTLPCGPGDDLVSTLPEGQRDAGGFWFPSGYARPGDIFTPERRKLQAKQQQVQRHRIRSRHDLPPMVSGSEGTGAADTAPSRPHAPPADRPAAPDRPAAACFEGAAADRPLPLPPPFPETPGAGSSSRTIPTAGSALSPAVPEQPPIFRAETLRPIVDSRQGSD